MKYLLSFFILAYGLSVFASSADELIKTGKAVKAIYDKGLSLPQIIDIQFAEQQQQSIPPKTCVMVIFERKQNTICPNDPMIGPNIDRGYAVCLNTTTNEVDSVFSVQTPDCN